MIILDTDVLSEVMRDSPDPAVGRWFDDQPRLTVWTTAITLLEIRFGIERLAVGRRRAALELAFEHAVVGSLEGRIIPFDTGAASEAALLMAQRQRSGRAGDLRDSMIAGIALARRAALATRNTRHFTDLPVPVIDPWAA